MSSCNNCHKAPPEVSLKRCAKCSVTQYCSRDCQKSDWKGHRKVCGKQQGDAASSSPPTKGLDSPVADPFTRLDNGTWLHDRPEIDVYRLLIDAYRMHVEDVYTVEGEAEEDSIYAGAPNGLRGFKSFLDDVEECHGLMPSWWNREKRTACERLGMDASQWCNLRQAVEKSDIIDHYGDPRFPMQLRFFAEAVFGEGPGGADGTAMRAMMVMMEQGGGGSGLQASAMDATTGNMFHMRP
ncbi:hypothetical protein AK830_g4846 [Neonectria ditissima]|uniref:MYND-type domain-containing protein n=1 Tax=Neonectria ditissima TaxID=78410 RepID=A0A0P7BFD5_9HYPO|nr:hypothetical protein AK830_g4846 [Neonectria ditissima]